MTSPEGNVQICLTPKLVGLDGPASFQSRLALGLAALGVQVTYDLTNRLSSAVLVVGGTRNLAGLWRVKRRGIPIIQRLAGLNWLHRRRRTGVRHYLRAEYGNLNLRYIRERLADLVIYQSHFARQWWERVRGVTPVPSQVIYNAVDLREFHPDGHHQRPMHHHRVLLVEGNLMGGYELGLENALALCTRLAEKNSKTVELMVVGRVPANLQAKWDHQVSFPVTWVGRVPRDRIPELDRSAHLLFSADLNAACPNSVIEALACGLPVVAFDTGALPELLDANSGQVVPFGGDPWQLDPPDLEALSTAAEVLLLNQDRYRRGARARAEAHFGLDEMVHRYLSTLTSFS